MRVGAANRPAVLDGGMGQLLADEATGISDELWAAGVAARSPGLVRSIHQQYLQAGADIITTATYQASASGYIAAGIAADNVAAEHAMAAAIQLAVDARNRHMDSSKSTRPLVAVSLGSIGATLGNLSEYTGDFGMSEQLIYEFHLQRLKMVAQCLLTPQLRKQIDLLAFETIPSLAETKAIINALSNITGLPPAWMSFNARSEECLGSGEPIESAVEMADNSTGICAVGFNCFPQHIACALVTRAKTATDKPIICYPNGQAWPGSSEAWNDSSNRVLPAIFAAEAQQWAECGAAVVGGCCRTTPAHIREVARACGES
ncbi:hypothetical protein IWW42_005093 [Coemansia sp. RSA 1085]|nr:hypothetical protein IWW40_003588 [Coemansia sp. RSA 1250]KAJ2668570.1 hypothetical protein IWW42_005093 [Coemansia sp. RSA 1085]